MASADRRLFHALDHCRNSPDSLGPWVRCPYRGRVDPSSAGRRGGRGNLQPGERPPRGIGGRLTLRV